MLKNTPFKNITIVKKSPTERQLNIINCSPASLKMITKYSGKYYSLQHLRDLCGNTQEGVSLAGISNGDEAIGLRTLATHCTVDKIIEKYQL